MDQTDTLLLATPALQSNPASLNLLVAQLHEVARRMDQADPRAGEALHGLLTQLLDHPDPRCTGLVVFAAALAERLADANADTANLYLRKFEVPQIDLFNALGQHVPLVRMATSLANGALRDAMRGHTHPTLIDVGMGTGRQFVALLDALAHAGELPKTLTVIGIEPALDALEQARWSLAVQAALHGVELHFHGFAHAAEAMTETQWQEVGALCTAPPAINAAFALHHIADDALGNDQRNGVLAKLRALNPSVLVMIEPDADHLEPRFFQRFRNCFAHFSAVFHMLDGLPMDDNQRNGLKVSFFGREIQDILGTPEALRSERHETAASWLARLGTTGFAPLPLSVAGRLESHAAVQVVHRGNRTVLTAGQAPLVSVIAAQPCARR